MKYKLTDETKKIFGKNLHRIVCVTAFGNVAVGDLGGWIESERNLSQFGNAWVGGNAYVHGEANVGGNAYVHDDAKVYGNAYVHDNANVGGNAYVHDNADVGGNAYVHGNAKVYGNAYVFGEAEVCDNAYVHGEADVGGNAVVHDAADYIVMKNSWSSGRYFTYTSSNDKWKVGCFYGSGEELIAKAYNDSELSGDCYKAAVEFVEKIKEAKEKAKVTKEK